MTSLYMKYKTESSKWTYKKNKNSQAQTTGQWLPEGKGVGGIIVKGKGGQIYGNERGLWMVATQYNITDDVSWECTVKTYIILLTKVTPINVMKKIIWILPVLWHLPCTSPQSYFHPFPPKDIYCYEFCHSLPVSLLLHICVFLKIYIKFSFWNLYKWHHTIIWWLDFLIKHYVFEPWLVWLSGLSTGLQSKG